MANRKKTLTLFACLLSILLLPERSWAKGSLNPLFRPAGNPPPTLEACTGTPVEIDANDPVLEGAGPCKIFRYGAISEGIVHIEITEKTFDWRVRVTAAESGSSWAASGGIGSRPSSIAAAWRNSPVIRRSSFSSMSFPHGTGKRYSGPSFGPVGQGLGAAAAGGAGAGALREH